MTRRLLFCLAALLTSGALTSEATAQPLGTFRWQLHPFCNVVTVAITQNGAVYRLEGTDDQCGGGADAALVVSWDGTATIFTVMRAAGRLSEQYAAQGSIPVGGGPISRSILGATVVTTPNILTDPATWLSDDRRAQIEREGFKAVAAAPLRSKGRVHGALVVHYWSERAFDAQDVAALRLLAQMAFTRLRGGKRALTGIALGNPKLTGELRQLAEQGAIRGVIARRFPLAKTAEAHAFFESHRPHGSVVIDVVDAGAPSRRVPKELDSRRTVA